MKNELIGRILTILMLISTVYLTSCGKKDVDPTIVSIEGTWDYKEFDSKVKINQKSDVDFFVQEFGLPPYAAIIAAQSVRESLFDEEDFENTRIIFSSNGSYEVRVENDIDESGTYVLSADNKTLTLTSDAETVVLDILELSANTLKIVFEEDEKFDVTSNGKEEDVNVKVEVTFIR